MDDELVVQPGQGLKSPPVAGRRSARGRRRGGAIFAPVEHVDRFVHRVRECLYAAAEDDLVKASTMGLPAVIEHGGQGWPRNAVDGGCNAGPKEAGGIKSPADNVRHSVPRQKPALNDAPAPNERFTIGPSHEHRGRDQADALERVRQPGRESERDEAAQGMPDDLIWPFTFDRADKVVDHGIERE